MRALIHHFTHLKNSIAEKLYKSKTNLGLEFSMDRLLKAVLSNDIFKNFFVQPIEARKRSFLIGLKHQINFETRVKFRKFNLVSLATTTVDQAKKKGRTMSASDCPTCQCVCVTFYRTDRLATSHDFG